MRLLEFDFLADENVDRQVVEWLRELGIDCRFVTEGSLQGCSDREILGTSVEQSRVVLTYDSDFGTLMIRDGEPCHGVVFVRPGNLTAAQVVSMLKGANQQISELEPPFLLLLEMKASTGRIRLRRFERS